MRKCTVRARALLVCAISSLIHARVEHPLFLVVRVFALPAVFTAAVTAGTHLGIIIVLIGTPAHLVFCMCAGAALAELAVQSA